MSLTLRHRAPLAASPGEIRRAWSRYLRETREAAPTDCPDVEEQAWHRVVSNLGALGAPVKPPDGP
jgi:hypothetical protein